MIVNKSMFPLQTGFSVISGMQNRFATLQMQLGTGEKASKLSEMGRDLSMSMSLSVRARLSKIEGFAGNIDTVALRLNFLDNTLSRLDKMESEARNSAMQGQYGTNNINMATLPGLSQARFDELVTLLNAEIAGRYLFGGANSDSAPLPSTSALLDGEAGRAGFKTVVGERKAADAGDGLGRLISGLGTAPNDNQVTLTEDGIHPFGLKLSTLSGTAGGAVALGNVLASGPGVPQRGDSVALTFNADPANQILPGQAVTMGFALPDGTETQITLTAIAPEDAPALDGQFVVGSDPAANAASFKTALDRRLETLVDTELAAASTFAAAQNFFNAAGEPVLRVDGNPATALKLASEADTVLWYRGQSPAVSAANLGRLAIATDPATNRVTLSRQQPESGDHGFQIAGIVGTGGIGTILGAPGDSAVSVQFASVPAADEQVTITLKSPDGAERRITLTAVDGRPGPGQFSRGADPAATASNFAAALNLAVTEAARDAEGNPRQSVGAQVDDSTRVNYGVQADESGLLRMMRTMAAMAVETYPDSDPSSKGRFDAMAMRQQAEMSEGHNAERGSIEILTMELGIALSTLDNAATRHTNYKAQLENLLSDIETVSKEDVAMEILALQTRLQASYQATAMVSQLSLVNFM
jgi:flagellin-like hook-associated protein FlgL